MTATDPEMQMLYAAFARFVTLVNTPDGCAVPVPGEGVAARLDAILAAMAGVILPRCLTLAASDGQRRDLYLAQKALHGWDGGTVGALWPVAADDVRNCLAALARGPVFITITRWDGPDAAVATGLPVSTIARAPALPPSPAPPGNHLARFVAALDTSEAALIRIEGDSVTMTNGAEPGLSRLVAFMEALWDGLLADPGPPDVAQLIVLTTGEDLEPGQAILVAKAGDSRLLLRFAAHLAVPVAALWLDCGQDAA